MYVQVKTLPEALINVLNQIGYTRADIKVEVDNTISPATGSFDGGRAFFAIVDMGTGQSDIKEGSWGGSNIFCPNNQVDNDTNSYPIPSNFAVIKGHSGGSKPVYAYITVRSDMIVPWLNAGGSGLSPRLQWIVDTVCTYTSAGRKNEFNQYGRIAPREEEWLKLIELGLIKRTKAGAISITTEGKNARTSGNGISWTGYVDP
jgi:hypothetical protein